MFNNRDDISKFWAKPSNILSKPNKSGKLSVNNRYLAVFWYRNGNKL